MDPTAARPPAVPASASVVDRAAFAQHWPEYLMEGAELGLFMISACFFTALLFHPGSPLAALLPSPILRRVLTGVAMGATAIGLIYSPWGKQSGAHFNPAVTLTFWRLGKMPAVDAVFYILAQFAGALAGMTIAAVLLGAAIADPSVNYVATLPGDHGPAAAFLAEFALSFGLMALVLGASNTPRLQPFTGLLCGAVVAFYIGVEAPVSGMSMNPARSFAPALLARAWSGLWIYFTAPPLGMLLAAEAYLRVRGNRSVGCAKLHHRNAKRCIFCRHLHG